MNAVVRVVSIVVALFPILCSSGQDAPRITLDSATHEQCLTVLRAGLRSDEFWPSMHAAEGLTLGGHSLEVIEYLTPMLKTETDDQHLCGIAREIVRAGDRSAVSVMLSILAGENNVSTCRARTNALTRPTTRCHARQLRCGGCFTQRILGHGCRVSDGRSATSQRRRRHRTAGTSEVVTAESGGKVTA